ncbi:MAG: hypothetical protein QM791_07760 [Ferruginibacter sp.]
MKAVHINKSAEQSFMDLLKEARSHETSKEVKKAAELYQRCIRLRPGREICYNRLMILYRKQKMYKKEVAVLRAGIKYFSNLYKGRAKANKQIRTLSNNILKSTGLLTSKGENIFEHEPVKKWKQRLQLLQEKYAAHL